jgi:hypothetical protein
MIKNKNGLVLFLFVAPQSDGKLIAAGGVATYKGLTKEYLFPFKAKGNTANSCLEKAVQIFTNLNKVPADFCVVQNVDAALTRLFDYDCYYVSSESTIKLIPQMLKAAELCEIAKQYGATIA